MDGFFTIL